MKHARQLLIVAALTSLNTIAFPQSNDTGQRPADLRARWIDVVRTNDLVGPHICLANELIGAIVTTPQGEAVGKLEDIVVHPGGEVAYAVISTGGMLGIGERLLAVPWSVLTCTDMVVGAKDKDLNNDHNDIGPDTRDRSREKVVLAVSKERLKQAPGFDKSHWPEMANRSWARDVDDYYATDLDGHMLDRRHSSEAPAHRKMTICRLSELKGQEVRAPDGTQLGDIHDVAVDTNGWLSYVILSADGALGAASRRVAVPWEALTFTREGEKGKKHVTLATTKERLMQAPIVRPGKDNEAELRDPVWIGGVYEFYSVPLYWSHPDVSEEPRHIPSGESSGNNSQSPK